MKNAGNRYAIVGGGSWGTALALQAARAGRKVSLWVHRMERAREISVTRENRTYLPGFHLPEEICVTGDLQSALRDANRIVLVVPSHVCRSVFGQVRELVSGDEDILVATKGIEVDTCLRMSQLLEEVWGEPMGRRAAVLSGPSFAAEVARGDPTTVVIASENQELASRFQEEISSDGFRAYRNRDVIGVEMGGALKNIIAIAAGVVGGLDLGHNTVAALLTRGLVEITRLALAQGSRPSTLAGLAGMGDLVLTCTGNLSRNRRLGEALGRGQSLDEIVQGMEMVAEGVQTTRAAREMARRHGIEMPITEEVYRLLFEPDRSPREALGRLLRRPLTEERTS